MADLQAAAEARAGAGAGAAEALRATAAEVEALRVTVVELRAAAGTAGAGGEVTEALRAMVAELEEELEASAAAGVGEGALAELEEKNALLAEEIESLTADLEEIVKGLHENPHTLPGSLTSWRRGCGVAGGRTGGDAWGETGLRVECGRAGAAPPRRP